MHEPGAGAAGLLDLSGRCAIVTGGAGILGRRICAGLAEHGARVAVVDVRGDAARALASELESQWGAPSIGIACDVTEPASVQAMVEQAAALGELRILFNHAAGKSDDPEAFFAPFETYSTAMWRQIMAVNLDGMFLVAREAGRRMIAQRTGGSVIFTSSIYGMLAPDDRIYDGARYMDAAINTPAVYAASKAGVNGLSAYLAARWARHGIRVNTLTPGGVESGQNARFQSRYAERVPLGRMGSADELVGAALYLASDASSYVTGHNLVVDGGLSVW
ncbi:SDR family oxidoreductase [Paenibacillus sp. IB182496]|uniref:SDR family oxidoreductase n=1 Tax=Paenibacillus sabuli TaxID=2772509 RepID=A0A927GQH6_9BACL|nr:SDR family oxidoreductase [Paenibacillus sabuli]MBD2844514.1 SDR family oxidoreductase [Paenibacillus sabuli]